MKAPVNKIIIIGLITLLFFGGAGIIIIEYFREISFAEELVRGWNFFIQFFIGISYGLFSSLICVLIIDSNYFKSEKEFYRKKITYFDLNYPNIIFVSLCAGIGEELFFRAALQPIIGLYPTAIIFVVLHGYINPKKWRISIYGIIMIIIMIGFGYLYEISGLITVIIAHTVIDIVLFIKMLNSKKMEASKNDH